MQSHRHYCPVPVSAMLCGEPDALSVIVIAAVCAPLEVGAKCPWIVQLAATARVVAQLFAKTKEDASTPVTAMLVKVSVAVPLLVKVTDCELLELPTVVAGKFRLLDDRVTGATGKPVPLSAMDWGEVLALSVILMVAVSAPVATGAKWPWIVQFVPAARLVPQLLAKTKEDASEPSRTMPVMVSVVVPLLVMVTDCEPLVAPTSIEPKERLVAERPTGGTTPVPLKEMDWGEVAALSVMVTDAVRTPPLVGAKWPCMEQLAPTARLLPQLLAKTKEEALAPVTAMLVMESAVVPVLVRVTDCEALVEPT